MSSSTSDDSQTSGPAGIVFCWVPAGSFLMGSPEDENGRQSDEVQHPVTISRGFEMAESLVTEAQWIAVMGYINDRFKSKSEDYPVRGVSWHEATEFCDRLTERDENDWIYSLPSEAEWEFACRAGTKGAYNVEGMDPSELLWGCVGYEVPSCSPAPVKKLHPNSWGLYDMHGNVEEWCLDWYAPDLAVLPIEDPQGPVEGSLRVVRGGCKTSNPQKYRSAARNEMDPGKQSYWVGFRPVRRQRGALETIGGCKNHV